MEKLKSQITVKDTLITIGILGATSVAVYLLQQFVSSNSDSHVPLLLCLQFYLFPDLQMDIFMDLSHPW